MPNRVQIKFIKDAQDHEYLLSEWECDFISSLAELPEERPLSDAQNEVLNRIINKVNRG